MHLEQCLSRQKYRQFLGALVTGDDADVDEALGHRRSVCGDANIAHASQIEAGTDSWAVDGGDRRDVELVQRQRNALDALAIALLHLIHVAAKATFTTQHVLDVASGRESLASARDDQRGNSLIRVDPRNRELDVVDQLLILPLHIRTRLTRNVAPVDGAERGASAQLVAA